MKKIQSLIVLIFIMCSSFTDGKMSPLIMNFPKEESGTTFYFLLTTDNANVLEKLLHGLGTPDSNTSGRIKWKNVSIDGVGDNLNILVTDGLFSRDTVAKTACFVPFRSASEKEMLLSVIQPNQSRESRIKIKDKAGNNILINGVAEFKAQVFLDSKLD